MPKPNCGGSSKSTGNCRRRLKASPQGGATRSSRCQGRPVRNSVGKVAPGIDVRGDGGYVLVPPSVHPSGRQYAWSVDSAGEFALAPDWLIAQVSRSGNSCEKPNGAANGMAKSGNRRRRRRAARQHCNATYAAISSATTSILLSSLKSFSYGTRRIVDHRCRLMMSIVS